MKTTMKSKRRTPVLLSILCAGLVATFLGGCAEGPYVAAYDTGYYPADIIRLSYDYYYGYPALYCYGVQWYAPAFATTMPTGRDTTPGLFTATGNNLRRALG